MSGEANSCPHTHTVTDQNWSQHAAVRLENHVVAKKRKPRPGPDIFPPPDFSSQAGARHDREISPRRAHDRGAGRAEDDQPFSKIGGRADVGTRQ